MSARLSEGQVTMLFVVQNNAPASVADVAGHLLLDPGPARSRLATLERRGLIARQYTGHHRGSSFAYTITEAGSQAIADRDDPAEADPNVCDLCGRPKGQPHMRACILNPARPRKTS